MPKWNAYTERQLSRISGRLKRKRVELFVRVLGLGPNDIVLDLGSEDGSYLARYYPYPHNIVLADIREDLMRKGVLRHGLRGHLLLPENGPIPASDGEYDAIWCNSAIEHVTVDRDQLWSISNEDFLKQANEHQCSFAQEIRRVGKGYFVQTPYLHFPLEAHSWLPAIQYLRHERQLWFSRSFKKLWIKQWTPDFCLYDLRRFREHYCDATLFHTERVLGVPKSLIAIRTGRS